MNIDKIIKACEMYSKLTYSNDYWQELKELNELRDRMIKSGNHDVWKGDIQVVATQNMVDLLNETTYDMLGSMMRKAIDEEDREATFEEYAKEVRYYYEDLTDENVHCGYDVIKDLWFDNESEHNNNEDGTYHPDYDIRRVNTQYFMKEKQ